MKSEKKNETNVALSDNNAYDYKSMINERDDSSNQSYVYILH